MAIIARLQALLGPSAPERGYIPVEGGRPSPSRKVFGIHLTKADIRLHFLCLFFGLGTSVWGYNIGVLSSVLVHPGWTDLLNNPTPPQKGTVTGIYYVGTWLGYVFISRPLSDSLGRRYAAMCGTAMLCVGAAIQASCVGAGAFAAMVAGRAICGAGVAIVSTSVPLYQSEISPAKERGRFVAMNHVGFVVGLAVGLWVGYGMTFWTGPTGDYYGWRISILLQLIPALTFAFGLSFAPESPRWLVEKGRVAQATSILHYLREGSFTPSEVEDEVTSMLSGVDENYRPGWRALFLEAPLFARLWRASLLHFMAQMCGAAAMKYYLPTLLKALGIGRRLALMAGAIEVTLKIGCSVLEMLVVDQWGRRLTLIIGCAAMATAMMFNGTLPLLYPDNGSRVADAVCVVFIFVYAFGYSLGFGPAAWLYGSEIFPTSARARGLNFSASAGSVGSIIVAQVWPVGIATFGSNIYFFFMGVNLVCIPIIYLFYPETKGRSLENMDELFGEVRAPAHRRAENGEDAESSGGVVSG
ncbi:related to ASD-3 ascus development protein 3 [Cephalotrichum gorgonifer]|uniref:Related to ASD-3 ascus development protein 3 n=1 Tax=Cephalotrichum gorgonifer TaxID=2041049 RepID=A0AAE8SY58_9PEZI|nr:related to ASD-3 ascus development protein 3 [Cephalotrichum gorgonifer]